MTQWDIAWGVVLGLALWNLLEAAVTIAVEYALRGYRRRKFDKIMADLEEQWAEFEEASKIVKPKKTTKKAAVKRK